jgi:SAM-dependent methyltransferase
VAVGLAIRLAGVLALDPEPDMLAQLRRRAEEEQVPNLVCVLAADRDLPALIRAAGEGGWGLLTVANALHWMDADAVFAAAARLLRPGGGIAVITQGRPLWLGERDWTRALRAYLEDWLGPGGRHLRHRPADRAGAPPAAVAGRIRARRRTGAPVRGVP